ncbi:MAG TPA: heme lyase CcmF/NrfE family subunit [Longimicrobiales bacterium]|nr:heme lyase CcmF/NrfE family subunit [Longimicrobiales bacterium]
MVGYGAIAVALALAVYGLVAAVVGVRKARPELIRSAERATYGIFLLVSISTLAMVYALVVRDFSISYVAQVGSRSTPLFFTVISLWGALEGSILFWGWVLAGYSAAAVYFTRGQRGSLVPYANATLLFIGIFFYILLLGPANPWHAVFPVPLDGPGPNPLLQNHWLMGVHPPLLYLGYVGMSVPFAFAIGALLSGRLDDAGWIRLTRRWTLVAWGFLSLAVMAGMWWSYEVLGWGGYWAWDPVENASFLPWLTATAFLHSAMVEERRGLLRVWTLSLVVSTFLLTIFGTFLTRSGIISSVHAFAEGPIGYYFLSFIAICLIGSLLLLFGRSSELATKGKLDSAVSRETVFLVNNLIFTAFTFTVLLGTVFPLVAEAVRGVKVSVGAPFFNRMTLPLSMMLLFLVGVGPALPWRQARMDELKRRFTAPAVALVLVLVVSWAAGARNPYTLMAFAFAAWALLLNLGEFWQGTAARMRAHGESPPTALRRLVAANSRRYGGYTAHIGFILMVVGIAASSSFRVEREMTLEVGETVRVEDYTLRLESVWAEDEPQRFVVGAEVAVLNAAGKLIGTLDPRLNYYPTSDQPITTPAVRERPHEDLYLTLLAFERDGSQATIQAIVEPLVWWIWAGGVIIGLGALISLLGTGKAKIGRRWVGRTSATPTARPAPTPTPVGVDSEGGRAQ